jgi:cardiolipin synthase
MSNNSSTRTIIILPDDTRKPIVDAIEAAKKSIKIKMFVFSDPDLINAVIAAKKRGIDVQVMLNPARRSGEEENSETRKLLEAAGIDVKDSNPKFGLTHEKSMVIDEDTVLQPTGTELISIRENTPI